MIILYYHPKHETTAIRTQVVALVHGFEMEIHEAKSEDSYRMLLSKNATPKEQRAHEALTMFANGLELLECGKKASCYAKYHSMFATSKK